MAFAAIRKRIKASLSGMMAGGLLLGLCASCCSVDTSEAECGLVPEDLNYTMIQSPDVFINPVSINGAKPDPVAWESAMNKLRECVSGDVWVADYLELQAPVDDDGNVIGRLRITTEKDGPTHIAIAFAPGWHDVDVGQFDRYMDDRQLIRYNCGNIKSGANLIFSSQKLWEIALVHEIFHSLGVPKYGSANWEHGHCTNHECVMYPSLGLWNIFRVMIHGYPMDLCSDCAGQIEAAKSVGGK